MARPLRHIGELARARLTRAAAAREDGQVLGELEAAPLELPAGLELEWLGVSGYRISFEGQTIFIDPYLSRVPFGDLLRKRPTLPDPAALDRFVRPAGEVAGVLVGHTHFDHAVDAPAIARRFGCEAYGSDSLVTLMGLHGLAGQTVEVEPYRTYELGPFEVSFTPSVHSKLLLGLAVPYDGDLTCEHLDSLTPGAYRCGQVWGIAIEVAGLRFYHQGSANLVDEAIREREVDVFLAGVAGRNFTDDYWERIVPRLDPKVIVPTHYDNFFRPLGHRMEFVSNVQLSATPRRRSAPSAPTPASLPFRVRIPPHILVTTASHLDTWQRSGRPCPPCASSTGQGLPPGSSGPDPISRCRRWGASRARVPRSPGDPRSVESASARLRAAALGWASRNATWSLPRDPLSAAASKGSRAAIFFNSAALRRNTGTSYPSASPRPTSMRPASVASSPPSTTKVTLPLARKQATSSNPSASNSRLSSSFLIRRPPRFIPRRKAT